MIKLLADECVNTDLIFAIKNSGFDIITVREAGLVGASDEEVFDFAFENQRMLFIKENLLL